MAFYNLKKKPALTTKEGETETMYADIVYSGTIPAERLIRGVAKRTGFKEGVIEGILHPDIAIHRLSVPSGYLLSLLP